MWISTDDDEIMKRSTDAAISTATDTSSVFAITYMYYSVLGTIIVLVVGTLVSLVTQSDDDQFEPRLLHPYVLKLARFWKIPLRNTKKETSASTFSIASCATTTTTTAECGEMKDMHLNKNVEISIIVSPQPI